MIYKIFTGIDYGSVSIKGQSIFEKLAYQCQSEQIALYEYEKIKKRMKYESNKEGNENYRFYCYILLINNQEHILGIHGQDNGFNSITLYSNSYFKNKNIEIFKEIKNIEKGKIIW